MAENLTVHLQDSIIQLGITSAEFLRAARPALDPRLFAAPASNILRLALDYYDRFQAPIGDHFGDEFKTLADALNDDQRELHVAYVNRVNELTPPNTGYVLSRLNEFVRSHALDTALLEAADLKDAGDYVNAERVLTEAFRSGVEQENLGLDYLYDFSTLTAHVEQEQYALKTGIDALDNLLGGFRRKDLVIIEGEYKGRKSFSCVHVAARAVLRRRNVLHISHENSLEETQLRYDRMFGWLVKGTEAKDIPLHRWDTERKAYTSATKRCRPISDVAAIAKMRTDLRAFGGRLIIRKYPQLTVNMHEIRRYVKWLEAQRGFVPDLIINDYPDKMAPMDARKNELGQLSETYAHCKRLADELNCVVIAPSQIDTYSIRSGRTSKTSAYGHKGKIGDCDVALGLDPQTQEQKEIDEQVIRVLAARNEREGARVTVWGALDAGQFAHASMVGVVEQSEDEDGEEETTE